MGAPLTDQELSQLKNAYKEIAPYLTEEGRATIEAQGIYVLDVQGDNSTPTIKNKECAYAIYDEKGILKCGMEQAYNDGKTTFKKPISCHLYPIRVSTYDTFDAINYDRWHICNPACTFGKELGVPVYQFLKEPLVRKYGAAWYEKLESTIKEK